MEPELSPFAAIAEPDRSQSALKKYLEMGLVRTPEYLDLVGQPGTMPIEYFEDLAKEEKEVLKEHKSAFKQLIKMSYW